MPLLSQDGPEIISKSCFCSCSGASELQVLLPMMPGEGYRTQMDPKSTQNEQTNHKKIERKSWKTDATSEKQWIMWNLLEENVACLSGPRRGREEKCRDSWFTLLCQKSCRASCRDSTAHWTLAKKGVQRHGGCSSRRPFIQKLKVLAEQKVQICVRSSWGLSGYRIGRPRGRLSGGLGGRAPAPGKKPWSLGALS